MRSIDQAPVIRHKGNGRPKIGTEYWMRASTFAKVLDDQNGLIQWKAKMTAAGVAADPSLIGRATTTPLDSSEWRDIVERACDRAGASQGADDGTSIHAAAEMMERGQTTSHLPDTLRRDAEGYLAALERAGLESQAAELFVANPGLKVAGTLDRLVSNRDGDAFVLDIKTTSSAPRRGSTPVQYATKYGSLAWAIQTYVYASARPYDGVFGWGDWADHGLTVPDIETAFVAVIPRGTGTCELVRLDLAAAQRAASVAALVLEMRGTTFAAPLEVAHA